jgi:hypothetical protein
MYGNAPAHCLRGHTGKIGVFPEAAMLQRKPRDGRNNLYFVARPTKMGNTMFNENSMPRLYGIGI